MHPSIPRPRPADAQIEALAEKHHRDPEQLLPMLRVLNEVRGTLSRQTLEDVAHGLRIPPKRAQDAATFYAMLSTDPQPATTVRLCDSVVCWLHGAAGCRQALEQELAPRDGWRVERSGCLGLCDRAPAAVMEGRQCGPLTPENISQTLTGWSGEHTSYGQPRPGETRFMLALAGKIAPGSVDDALAHGVWSGLSRMLGESPGRVIAAIEAAGLRGRGGAGFPTARKWRTVAEAPAGPRYIICNADESEPLAFKDRVLLETNPQSILEGMALAAYAVGAAQGFVYIRGEYEPQAMLMERAVAQARERGWLGERIGGTDFSFDVHVHRGAGAYICGEETALLESLEGHRGEPRTRPPYPAISGYRGHPTVINNVETFALAAAIAQQGVDAYRAIGSPEHPGTRLYTILGHVRRPGLFEAPLGLTVRQVIDDFGGGLLPGAQLSCALVGGAAGTLISAEQLDVPLGFPGMSSTIPAGTGAVLACDHTVSPVAVLRELMHFFEHESCGKCTPCRIGTSEARRTLDVLLSGNGTSRDLDRLRQLANTLCTTSLCGLGVSAADPIHSALANFEPDFEKLIAR